jgi:hypothetical protein
VVTSLPLEKPVINWITATPQRISPRSSNKYPTGLIKLILSGNAAIWGKYVWTNMAAIKDGSTKRMIFPPCPTMLIPFCFFKMLIMMRLLFLNFLGMFSSFSFVLLYVILPSPGLLNDAVLAGNEAARLQDVDGRYQY